MTRRCASSRSTMTAPEQSVAGASGPLIEPSLSAVSSAFAIKLPLMK